jgi:hypothetical protein
VMKRRTRTKRSHGHEGSPEVADRRDRRAPRASIAARPLFRTKRVMRILAIAGRPGVTLEAGPRFRTKRGMRIVAIEGRPGASVEAEPRC